MIDIQLSTVEELIRCILKRQGSASEMELKALLTSRESAHLSAALRSLIERREVAEVVAHYGKHYHWQEALRI